MPCCALAGSEWQVRKAAADTLAALADALLADPAAAAGGGGPAQLAGGGSSCDAGQGGRQGQGQAQGLDALNSMAPAVSAAVEQHLKYDRIPQVRQAAAAVLQRLQRLPGMLPPQEQRPPAQQLSSGAGAGRRGAAPTAGEAAALATEDAAHAAAALPGLTALGRCRGNLKAIIAERRRQLQQSGWQPAAAAAKAWRGSDDCDGSEVDGYRAGGLRQASGNGSPEEGGIAAWQPGGQHSEEQGPLAPGRDGSAGMAGALRPPSAEAFTVAAGALGRLQLAEEQPGAAARKRRGWGSLPASPAKLGSPSRRLDRDIPVQVFAPPARPHSAAGSTGYGAAPVAGVPAAQQAGHMWRENPLAHSGEARAGQAAPALAAPAPQPPSGAVHHIEHPEVGEAG